MGLRGCCRLGLLCYMNTSHACKDLISTTHGGMEIGGAIQGMFVDALIGKIWSVRLFVINSKKR